MLYSGHLESGSSGLFRDGLPPLHSNFFKEVSTVAFFLSVLLSGISAGGTVVSNPQLQPATPVDPSPAPPQTGAAASLVPFLFILAAAALFAVSRKRRSC